MSGLSKTPCWRHSKKKSTSIAPSSNLMGLDDNKLTYLHAGRYKQLSQFGGKVIPELLA